MSELTDAEPPEAGMPRALVDRARNHGVTLGEIARRATDAAGLRKASLVMRAQSYGRRLR